MRINGPSAKPWSGRGFALWVAALCVLGAVLIVWRDPAFDAIDPAVTATASVALNAIPFVLLAFLLLGLSGRPLISAWFATFALWAIYGANGLKLLELGTPLMPGDALIVSNLGDHGGFLLARYIEIDARHMIEAILAVAITIFLLVYERKARLSWRARVPVAIGTVAIAVSLLVGAPVWKTLYDEGSSGFKAWTPQTHARRMGLFAHLLRYRWENAGDLPAPDHAAAEKVLSRHRDVPPSDTSFAAMPDIVILQSESLFDAARLRGLEPADVLPGYRALASMSRHGDLWVPTFGGGTIRTEFEVLTGIAMRYFPETLYPYFRLTATPVESLPSVLAARGYRTIAVHPNDRAFWNRAAAFSSLGFAEFDAIERFVDVPLQGYYASDDALVTHILKRLDETSGTPMFVFAISIENHGPYENYPNADAARRDAQPAPANLSDDAQRTLRGYLYHVQNADRALARLADALRARPRRTLLLFYGDHLPSLSALYRESAFDDGAAPREQPVPWLLFDTAAANEQRIDTAAFYLPALLLSAAGIDDGSYFRFLDAMRRDDSIARGWVPHDSEGLGAVMQLRQRGELDAVAAKLGASDPSIARSSESQR